MPDLPDVQWTKAVLCVVLAVLVSEVLTLNGSNVCMVKQKYNITKLVKYRAPMSIRTYEWCFSMPPRCSKWNTEMRDLTRLETEERIAEVAVCCPGYKMREVSCVPICPNGKTGPGCSKDCPENKWGPNCVNDCKPCAHGSCSPINGECWCEEGWQGESCESSMPPTTIEDILTTTKTTPITMTPSTKLTTIPTPTTSPKTQATTSFPSRTSPKSTTEVIEATETIFFNESIPPIEMKIATTITKKYNETSTTSIKEDVNGKTEKISTTTSSSTTVFDTFTKSIKRIGKDITTGKPEELEDTIVVSDIAHILNKQSDNANLSKSTLFNDIANTTSTEIFIQNVSTIMPVLGRDLVKNNKKEDEKLDKVTIFQEMNRTTTFETSTTTMEVITKKPKPKEIKESATENKILFTNSDKPITLIINTTEIPTTTEQPIIVTTSESRMTQTTQKAELTTYTELITKVPSTTMKFKPKEIWIKPAQKGDSTELKNRNSHELLRHKSTNKDISINTTPKTIIVSIIPTSVSYATFKKIALTTMAYIPLKINMTTTMSDKKEEGFTKPMPNYLTSISSTTEISSTSHLNTTIKSSTKTTSILPLNETTTVSISSNTITPKSVKTNGMNIAATSNNLTLFTNIISDILTTTSKGIESLTTTKPVKTYHWITPKESSKTNKTIPPKFEEINKTFATNLNTNNNKTKTLTFDRITTEAPADEEVFHILTEPEHITAVMSDKENDRTSMDLKSVISIAGGVMMAVITVAVIIVMIERCKRPSYEDVRKVNDIRMQVLIDGNDVPPPYVRSIFHTPLPEPPMQDKCHYQPISTLDRNLKQFMRPVVVQTISPIMLENFRGILECHYDHLPRRSHDFQPIPVRCSVTPSNECCELTPLRANNVTDHDIDSMKREAKLDVIDNTTSEPLYAEIPCWRPPSEHAIEILNLNGEAVTEL